MSSYLYFCKLAGVCQSNYEQLPYNKQLTQYGRHTERLKLADSRFWVYTIHGITS